MMNYELTAEQKTIKKEIGKFCQEAIAPSAALFDESPRDKVAEQMKANFQKLAQANYFGIALGDDLVGAAVAGEALAKACPSTFLAATSSVVSFGIPVKLFGTAAQKAQYVDALVKAQLIGAMGYTEAQAGSDLGGISASAAKRGDGWVLTGVKDLVTNAPLADAFLVLAWTNKEAGREKGLSFFIVEKNAAGLTVGEPIETMGLRGALTAAVQLEGCEASLLGGQPNDGYAQLQAILEYLKLSMASLSLGIGLACMEISTALGKSRQAFGKPIGLFEGVGAKLAVMFTHNDLSRLLTLRAAWSMEQREKESAVLTSCAKLFASEAVNTIADLAMQVHGGHGYLRGTQVERLYRDARFAVVAYGTSELQRAAIAKDCLDKFKAA